MAAKYTSQHGVTTGTHNRAGVPLTSSSTKYQSAIYVTRLPSDVSVVLESGNHSRYDTQHHPASASSTADRYLRHQAPRSGTPSEGCCAACARAVFRPYDFRRPETERLYSAYAFRSRFVDIRALGILLTALFLSLAAVDFVCAARPTIDSVTNVGLGATTSVLLVVLHTRLVTRGRLPLIAGAIVCVCLVFAAASMLPVSRRTSRALPAEGVWRLCYVVFGMGVLVPLPPYIVIGVTTVFCIAHGSVAALTAVDGHAALISRQIVANSLLMFGVLLISVSIHHRRERIQRKLFNAIRQCTSTGLRIQEERSKMERLLASVVPQHLVAGSDSKLNSLCRRLPLAAVGGASRASSARLQSHDSVSMLFADIVGLSSLSTHSSPVELVQMLNELFGRFDQLAAENHCSRVQLLGDGYYAVCGLPDVRPDHAKCCVEFGLDLVDIISFLRDSIDAKIGIRIGVHSGQVECGVIGLARWRFDVWSSETCVAEQMVQTGLQGRVHVTEVTMDHLHGEFDAELGRGEERSELLRSRNIRTYLIVFDHPRKRYGAVKQSTSASGSSLSSSLGGCTSNRQGYAEGRQSLKNISGLIARLVSSSVRFNADIPFANVFPQLVSSGTLNHRSKDYAAAGGSADTPLLRNNSSDLTSNHSRLDKHLWLALSSGTIDKSKFKSINCLTLCFKNYSIEYEYKSQCDKSFPASMLYSLILLAISVAVQALVLPRTLLLLLLFLVCFAWMSVLLMLFLGYRIKCTKYDIRRSWHIRIALSTVTILLVASVSLVNVMCCRGGRLFPYPTSDFSWGTPSDRYQSRSSDNGFPTPASAAISVIAFNRDQHLTCDVPHYVHIAAILSLSSVVVFKMAAIGRLAFLMIIAAAYVVVVEVVERPIFTQIDQVFIKPEVPTDIAGLFMMFHFVVALYVISRRDEWTRRLMFLWFRQSVDQQHELTDVELENDRLLINILPRHVIPFFTASKQHNKVKEIYCEYYNKVIVGFASVANFYDSDLVKNAAFRRRQGFRLLNDVINSFDELLEEHRFIGVDKIKTIGNVYMFVVGLKPHHVIEEMESSIHHSMSTAIQFCAAMNDKLFHVNESLALRVGLDIGPVVTGVVGARKPQFDVWGNCVNLASCLERAGLINGVNVTADVFQMVHTKFQFQCRGPTRMKTGSGMPSELTTYFMSLDSGRRLMPSHQLSSSDFVASVPASMPCVVQSCSGPTSPQLSSVVGSAFRSSSMSSSHDNASSIVPPPPRISMTPPSSLSRRRRMVPDVAGKGSFADDVPRGGVAPTVAATNGSVTNGYGGNLLTVQATNSGGGFNVDGGRSPDLPVVHFRNANIAQGAATANINISGGLSNSCGVWGVSDGIPPRGRLVESSRPATDGTSRQHSSENTSRNKTAVGNAFSGRNASFGESDVSRSAATNNSSSLPQSGLVAARSNGTSSQQPLPSITETDQAPSNAHHDDVYSDVLKKEDLEAIMRDLLTAESSGTGSSGQQRGPSPPIRKASDQRPKPTSAAQTPSSTRTNSAVSHATPDYGVVNKNGSRSGTASSTPAGKWPAHSSASLMPNESNVNGRHAIDHMMKNSHSNGISPSAGSGRPGHAANSAVRDQNKGNNETGNGNSRRSSPPPLPPPPPSGVNANVSSSKQHPINIQTKPLSGRNGVAVPVVIFGGQQRTSAFRPVLRTNNGNILTRPAPPHWTAASAGLYRQPPPLPPLPHQQVMLQVPKYLINRDPQRNPHGHHQQRQQQTAATENNDSNGSRQQGPSSATAAALAAGGRRGLQQHHGLVLSSFRVRRATGFNSLNRLCRSLDNLASDVDDCTPRSEASSRPDSPAGDSSTYGVVPLRYGGGPHRRPLHHQYGQTPTGGFVFLHPDDVSLSSFDGTGSEMSRSDPALSSYDYESAYGASCGGCDSEYDNYRPGMASDEDYFVPEPISDVDIDMFDDDDLHGMGCTNEDIENVTVSETYATAAWSLASSG